MIDWMADCTDFMDTAALVENMDLVITVDTAIAHLAGALARPVWLLNRLDGDWRWGLSSSQSAWYPTMRIFRQEGAHDWGGVIRRVADELRQFVQHRMIAGDGFRNGPRFFHGQ